MVYVDVCICCNKCKKYLISWINVWVVVVICELESLRKGNGFLGCVSWVVSYCFFWELGVLVYGWFEYIM